MRNPGAIRLVTFLTDGYIGNEAQVLGLVTRHLGDARLFALGVGTSVNRYLLDELGRMGRGFTRYMDPTEQIEAVASELAERLETPVLTDVEIDWGGLEPDDVTLSGLINDSGRISYFITDVYHQWGKDAGKEWRPARDLRILGHLAPQNDRVHSLGEEAGTGHQAHGEHNAEDGQQRQAQVVPHAAQHDLDDADDLVDWAQPATRAAYVSVTSVRCVGRCQL